MILIIHFFIDLEIIINYMFIYSGVRCSPNHEHLEQKILFQQSAKQSGKIIFS